MCGIAGFVNRDRAVTADPRLLRGMADAIVHRGPDEDGYLLDHEAALGMRRLRIIDLAGGSQPIFNEDRTVGVVYNGEIYNYPELRERLLARGHTLRTHCDTEVIVHLYEEHGPDLLDHLNGMFAIALWDARARRLLLARDRLGVKPLHFLEGPTALVFGSEIKSLLLHPDARREIDPVALSRYLLHECVPAPRTLFKGIRKLAPGHRLVCEQGNVRIERWWRLRCAPASPSPRLDEAEERLESLLGAAVRRRLLSDVPLGAFLSGGIDSSTIAAFMREQAGGTVETFSIGFHEASFDESAHARRVAAHLGTRHHEETLSASEMLRLVPHLPEMLDEPLGDASILPTYLLSRFTRQRVTVALSGDGGDELFAGYPTYLAHRAASVYRWLPGLLRRGVVGPIARALPVSTRNFSLDFAAKRFVSGEGLTTPERHAVWMGSFAPGAKRRLLSTDLRLALAEDDDFETVRALWAECDAPDELSKLLHLDLGLYLQDDVLTKVDRASMACSLEVRNPFLDYTVVEFAAGLPPSFKVRGLTTKFLLKQVARKRLPAEIVTRPKKGFGVPMAAWLKGPLRDLALSTLAPDRLRGAGLFDPAEVKRLLDEHLAGAADHRKALYTLLAFELWREAWIERRPAAAPRTAAISAPGPA